MSRQGHRAEFKIQRRKERRIKKGNRVKAAAKEFQVVARRNKKKKTEGEGSRKKKKAHTH